MADSALTLLLIVVVWTLAPLVCDLGSSVTLLAAMSGVRHVTSLAVVEI